MCHNLLIDSNLFLFLQQIDEDIAVQIKQHGCPFCGGRLDTSNYPRKPRGGPPALSSEYDTRFSFCCDQDGCRKRITPPSVRFLGRKVYLGCVVLLVSAMRDGPNPWSLRRLQRYFGITLNTLKHWRILWQNIFPRTQFWQLAKERFAKAIDQGSLPRSLLLAFGKSAQPKASLLACLRFLTPITCELSHLLQWR